MPEKDKPNLFSRLTLGAMMADAPVVAQASGWESRPINKGGITMGDPSSKGATNLRNNIAQIAYSAPLIDMGAELAMPYIVNGLGKVFQNAYSAHNLAKSKQIVNNAQQGIKKARAAIEAAKKSGNVDELNKWKTILKMHNQTLNHGFSPKKGDITDLAYFYKPTKAVRVGKKVYLFEGKGLHSTIEGLRTPNIYRTVDDAKQGVEYAKDFMPPVSLADTWAKDWQRLPDGRSLALTYDGAISKDAYPLLQRKAIQKVRNNEGTIKMMKDGPVYRMQRLNHFGSEPKSLKRIDKGIEMMRKELGDPNIPNRVSIFGTHYTPAFTLKKGTIGEVDDIMDALIKDYPELFK